MNYIVKSGVTLPAGVQPKLKNIADQYFAVTKKKLTITDGVRTPKDQAERMYDKLVVKDDALNIYKKQNAAMEIKQAYDSAVALKKLKAGVIADMAAVIKKQVAKFVYISSHLVSGAVDVSVKGMSSADKKSFKKIADTIAKKVLHETKPVPHFHLQF